MRDINILSLIDIKEINRFNISFVLILFFFITLTTIYSISTPAFEGYDESAHYAESLKILENKVPDQYGYGASQPLYYLIGAIIISIIQPLNFGSALNIHILRVFPIMCGIVTLVFTYKIGQVVFHENRLLSLYSMLCISLIPLFSWQNSVFNNDNLVWSLSTISIFFLLKFFTEIKKTRLLILAAVFTSLAISTKSNALVIYPIVLVPFIYCFISKQLSVKSFFKKFSFFIAITIVFSWWQILYRSIFNLDPLDFGLLGALKRLIVNHTFVSPSGIIVGSTSFSEGLQRIFNFDFIYTRLFRFAFGGFSYPFVWPPEIYFEIAFGGFLISLAGLCLFFINGQIRKIFRLKTIHLVILFSSIIFMIGGIFIDFLYSDSGHVRYIFPVISAYGIFFTVGIYSIIHRIKFILIIPIVFLIILNLNLIDLLEYQYKTLNTYANKNNLIDYSSVLLLKDSNWKYIQSDLIGTGHIDSIGEQMLNSQTNFVVVDKTKPQIRIDGWGVVSHSENVNATFVFVDDKVNSKAYYGLSRQDVANAFGLVSSYSGWVGMIDTTDLEKGCHKVSIRLVSGNHYYKIGTNTSLCTN